VKCTQYFLTIRKRPDRAIIRDEWVERVVLNPTKRAIQADGRIRLWGPVPKCKGSTCVLYYYLTTNSA